MTSATTAREAHGGVARLVEAERRWERTLVDARARAASRVLEAESAAAADAARADEALIRAVNERRRTLDASVEQCARAARDELAARSAKYTGASDELVARIAAGIADRAPWFARAEAR